jgi:hypothetical protein
VVCPEAEGLPHFLRVSCSIVDPGDRCPAPGDVIKDCFDYMRKGPEISEPGRATPPKVVKSPVRQS